MKKTLAFLLAALLLISAFSLTVTAADDTSYEIKELNQGYEGYKPIPLLILVVSFDPNGNGVDDVKAGKSSTDKELDTYGEQWAYSPESHWEKICFSSTGKSLNTYYQAMSKGNFRWIPVDETYGNKNNGIVYVSVNMMHPNARTGSSQSQYGEERLKAIQAAAQYVDFASYDTNGDGFISFEEMSFVFIIAGYNSKFGTGGRTNTRPWGMNCFEVSTSNWSTKVDGVNILNGSRRGYFCYCGEYQTASDPIMYGTIAHELGHVLGAKDLYTYSGYTWAGSPGNTALQGGGSGNYYSGEQAGTSPSAIDPYYLEYYGFERSTVVNDGTYTLYSRTSKKGEYNIIRINTNDPGEYYLIENRYKSTTTVPYDGLASANTQGIMIWHVDDFIMENYTLPDCYKTGTTPRAPGLTPISPAASVGFNNDNGNPWDKSDGTFIAKNVAFVGTDDTKFSTRLSGDEVGDFDLQIEMLSAPGDEMQIKVTGTVVLAPYINVAANESTTDSLIVRGKVSELNAGTLTSIKLTVATDAKYTKLVGTYNLKPEEDGKFSLSLDSLTPKTTYYFKLEATGSNGTTVKEFKGYTKAMPKVRTNDYIVYMYRGMTDANNPYEKTVKCGEVLTYNFPMTKSTQLFGGWYLDTSFTDKYDMAFTKDDTEEMYLYARWIDKTQAVSMKVVGAATLYEVFAIQTGETFDVPVLKTEEGQEVEGWYSDPDFTTPFDFEKTIDEAGEVTVYVKFKSTGSEQTETTAQTTTETVITSETTTVADVETTSSTAETTKPSGGCGSAIGAGAVICGIVSVFAGALCLKKKKED
ncbi:MAG: InlB B-repeat-containing protein [Clostridia bacterium]|nr:InlB B-repeat-containing protein [Clostridia bacterium]